MDWISVRDRLPDKIGGYLVYATYDQGRGCAIVLGGYVKSPWRDELVWEYDHDLISGHEYEVEPIVVTHWMPLPEPPKDTEK